MKETVPAKDASKSEELHGDIDHGEVVVGHEEWATIEAAIDRRNDLLVIERRDSYFFVGRYDDHDVDATTGITTVRIAGRERDAVDARPTGPNVIYQNTTDEAIVEDVLEAVPELQPGTIEGLASNLSMTFSHAERSKAIRDVVEATGAELRYQFDGEVDYLERRGVDRDDVRIAPDEQTIVGRPRVVYDAREEVTHIRGLGAQSGPNQVVVEVESNEYDGGKEVWREYENKDIVEEERLEAIVERRLEEYEKEPRHLKVEARIVPAMADVELGDRVEVTLPRAGIDRKLRVVEREEHLDGDNGHVVDLVLSNRVATDDDLGQQGRKDLQRFNRGFQGYVDRSQVTSGWNPAGDGEPQTLEVFNWPDDVVEEKVVELAVQGRAWRAPIEPLEHSHTVTIDDHDHDVTISIDDHTHDYELRAPDHAHVINSTWEETDGALDGDDEHTHDYLAYLPDDQVASYTEETETSEEGGGTVETTTTDDGGGTTTSSSEEVGVAPRVITRFDGTRYFPTGVTVRVNGQEVTTVGGNDSATWIESVDLTGYLTPGTNTIEAEPADRGSLNLALASELFRRGQTVEDGV